MKWNELKENIGNVIKLFLLLFMMTCGFWISYCFLWCWVGFPLTNWALWLLIVVALLSEYGYYRWMRE